MKILQSHGFEFARQKGSHVVMKKIAKTEKIITVIPVHKELKKGTLRGIARQAGIDSKELGL